MVLAARFFMSLTSFGKIATRESLDFAKSGSSDGFILENFKF